MMSIDNWYPKNRAFCIRNDDWVQVQGAQRSGSWKDYLYMWSNSVGNNETFTVHMGEAQKQDFTPNLRYIQ